MRHAPAWHHLLAMGIAGLLVLGLKIQDTDISRWIGPANAARLRSTTPYFPGLDRLAEHEIFSPAFAARKKIVLLGSSVVDSVGCDSSWSVPDKTRQPSRNAHSYCSIAGQMNAALRAAGLIDWRVFNLARNGAGLTSMLYIYTQILAIKPEIVIFGDDFPYYLAHNADIGNLKPEHIARLHAAFGETPETVEIWSAYLDTLKGHGWQDPTSPSPTSLPAVSRPKPREPVRTITTSDVIAWLLRISQTVAAVEGPPLPVKPVPFRDWAVDRNVPAMTANPDPDFGYFQGMRLFSTLQKQHGGHFYFYFSPLYDRRSDGAYRSLLTGTFAPYLDRHAIPHASLVDLALKPMEETYDGVHQTLYGNRIIARILLADMMARGLVK